MLCEVAPQEPDFIRLAEKEPFGVGGRRNCFTHPSDPGKCVKVLRQDKDRTIRGKRSGIVPPHLRRAYDNNADEQRVLEALYRRIGPPMRQHLPLCHGVVATDLGPGLVVDLVRDCDGPISRSLRELISTGYELEQFRQAFDQLGRFLAEHCILTRSLLDHNLAVQAQADGSWRFYLIDGFGDPAWLPIARWVRPIGLRKVHRRLVTAWQRFEALSQQGGVTPELIASSSWGQGFLNHRGD